MKVHLLALFVIIGLAIAMPAVSATVVEEKNGYIVTTVDTPPRSATFSTMSTYTLVQGQTRWHTTSVPAGGTTFVTDLNWGNPANSLSLTIYTPDASVLGPYYDEADGLTDGRVYLMVYRPAGLASGTWSSKVYGSSVTGIQTYSYSASWY